MNLRTDPKMDSALRQLAARRNYVTEHGKLDVSRMVSDDMRNLIEDRFPEILRTDDHDDRRA